MQSAGLFREALRRFIWKRQGGGVAPTPPPTPAKVAKHRLRARVKELVLRRILALFFPEILNGHIWKSRVLTLNHLTKIVFFEIFRKF